MSWQLVAQGNPLELALIDQYESQYNEGNNGLLELTLTAPVSSSTANELENLLASAGVEGVRVETGSPILFIYWTKGFPWLAIIAATILAFTVIAILVVSWRLFKEVPGSVVPVSLGLAVILLFVLLAYRRSM